MRVVVLYLFAAIAAGVFASPTPAEAAAPPWRTLDDGGWDVVVDVVDGDTVTLASGATVRLVGVQAPELPLDRPGVTRWPLATQAKQRLYELLMNKPVHLFYGGRRFDRYGRKLAHLWRADQYGRPIQWVQGALLDAGLVRVYTFADNRALAREMLARERRARRERAGIWRNAYYQVQVPEDTDRMVDSFQVVAGRVVSTAVVRGRGYINFGDDWHTDFTISLAPKVVRAFPDLATALPTYVGKKIRVRGWIKRFNGPMIEVTHPEQIELVAGEVGDQSTDENTDSDTER